jgi:hypothetical protein
MFPAITIARLYMEPGYQGGKEVVKDDRKSNRQSGSMDDFEPCSGLCRRLCECNPD